MSYLGLSRSLSDRLLVRLTRQCRGETGNYVWGSISGVVRGELVPALAEFSVRKRQPPARHRFRAVIKLLTASLSLSLYIYIYSSSLSLTLVSSSWNDKTRMAELLDGFYRRIARGGSSLCLCVFINECLEQKESMHKDIVERDESKERTPFL